MEIATVWVELDSTLKNNVRKEGVTPAQALIMRKMFGKKIVGQAGAKGLTNPFVHLGIVGEEKRDTATEYARLVNLYGDKVVEEAFPGENPSFPQTFKEIGLSETEETGPAEGKKHTIEPLTSLKKGDLDASEKAELEKENPMQAMVLKQQQQIEALTENVSTLVAGLALLVPKQPASNPAPAAAKSGTGMPPIPSGGDSTKV